MAKVYILRFESDRHLARAFDHILGSPDVDSCVVESQGERVRFFAPEAPAEKLIERIYLEGGLSWCSRHRVDQLPASA